MGEKEKGKCVEGGRAGTGKERRRTYGFLPEGLDVKLWWFAE